MYNQANSEINGTERNEREERVDKVDTVERTEKVESKIDRQQTSKEDFNKNLANTVKDKVDQKKPKLVLFKKDGE